jgi:diaminohydroxyphosphoribosylaminopyrimidine deaminase/5-amino-6-(5-phosphoribosylamino)uracil reductase
VVLKLAASLDGRTAAPDGTSRWITGEVARADAHRLRAESDAVLVGAGTVRADDPALTVRHGVLDERGGRDPLRVVLGTAPPGAKIHPCVEVKGDLGDILDDLGQRGILQLLVEGGAGVAGAFHRAGLVEPLRGVPGPCAVRRRRRPGFVPRGRSRNDGRRLAGPYRGHHEAGGRPCESM